MTIFTEKHDEELHEFFAGVLKGRCGVRSPMGGQLDAMASAAVCAPKRPGVEYMLVKPEDRHAHRDFAVTEDMMAAARAIGRMERILGELDAAHIRILRAHYADPSKAETRRLAVVLGSEDEAIALRCAWESGDRETRRAAKEPHSSAQHRVRIALEAAQEAYAGVCDVAKDDAQSAYHRTKARLAG
jgi:hypothetical protein